MAGRYTRDANRRRSDFLGNARLVGSSYGGDERNHMIISPATTPCSTDEKLSGFESYSNSVSNFSSQSSAWQHSMHRNQQRLNIPLSSIQVIDTTSRRQNNSHPSVYMPHQTPWPLDPIRSNSIPIDCGSTFPSLDGMAGLLPPPSGSDMVDANLGLSRHSLSLGASNGVITPDLSPQSMSLSPSAEKSWTINGEMIVSPASIPLTRVQLSSSPVLTPDGFRQKNSKVDIPEGRTLDTIDHLISKAKDDQLMKELKVQKRLLKNREAALQSRQRKKLHTENLEKEEKGFKLHIVQLENELTLVKEQLEHDRASFGWQKAEDNKSMRNLRLENESLHQKVCYLQDALQRIHGTPTSTVPSSGSYADFADDMTPLAFTNSTWSGLVVDNPFQLSDGTASFKQEPSLPFATVERFRGPNTQDAGTTDATTCPLLLLLLAGAFIAKSPSPERAASAIMSQLPRGFADIALGVVDDILGLSRLVPTRHLAYGGPRDQSQGPSTLDNYTLNMISTLRDSATPDVILDLKELFERASARIKAETATSLDGHRAVSGVSGRRR